MQKKLKGRTYKLYNFCRLNAHRTIYFHVLHHAQGSNPAYSWQFSSQNLSKLSVTALKLNAMTQQ
jgi:hypothetical protein